MIDSKIMETTKSILKDFGNTYFSDKGNQLLRKSAGGAGTTYGQIDCKLY